MRLLLAAAPEAATTADAANQLQQQAGWTQLGSAGASGGVASALGSSALLPVNTLEAGGHGLSATATPFHSCLPSPAGAGGPPLALQAMQEMVPLLGLCVPHGSAPLQAHASSWTSRAVDLAGGSTVGSAQHASDVVWQSGELLRLQTLLQHH